MKKFLMIACLALLSACATQTGNYSNASPDVSEAMASDVANYIDRSYSPAKTQLNFTNEIPVNDYFGLSLQDNLRKKGFAVQLHAKNKQSQNMSEQDKAVTEPDTRLLNLPLRYIVDHLDANSYRVTVYLPESVFSRAYSIENGVFTPLGNWGRGN